MKTKTELSCQACKDYTESTCERRQRSVNEFLSDTNPAALKYHIKKILSVKYSPPEALDKQIRMFLHVCDVSASSPFTRVCILKTILQMSDIAPAEISGILNQYSEYMEKNYPLFSGIYPKGGEWHTP